MVVYCVTAACAVYRTGVFGCQVIKLHGFSPGAACNITLVLWVCLSLGIIEKQPLFQLKKS